MRVLLTGGAGFIGSHIAEALLENLLEVAVLDDLSSGRRKNVPADAVFYELDIRDETAVRRCFQQFRPQIVNHQAAQVSVSRSVSDPVLDASTNILGSLNVLNAARDYGCKLVIFASTGGAIYGEVPAPQRAKTQRSARPMSPYAVSKYAVERYLETYRERYGLGYKILRYANVYGQRQDPQGEAGVVAIFCQRLNVRRPITVYARSRLGDRGCVRDYVHVKDVVKVNMAAIHGKIQRSIVNVATGVGTDTTALAGIIEKRLGIRAVVEFEGVRAGDLKRSVLDPEGLNHEIGTLTSLECGMADTVEWFRQGSFD